MDSIISKRQGSSITLGGSQAVILTGELNAIGIVNNVIILDITVEDNNNGKKIIIKKSDLYDSKNI